MSIANFLETTILDLVFNATSYAGQSTVHVKLHTGDPGEACTNNAATHTTRAAATFGAAASGAIANDADIVFSSLAASQTISHISIWDHVSAGNALWYGALVSPVVTTSGGSLTIPSGDLIIALD